MTNRRHTHTRRFAAIFSLAAALVALVAFSAPALSQNADCERLRQQIAEAGNSSGGQYQAAAERQAGEIERMSGYARSIGCENKKFLFFGAEPPAQCAQINGQLERMRANLSDLRARSGGGRGDLVARYNAQCVAQPAQRSGNLFDALFGNHNQPQNGATTEDVTDDPLTPDGQLANPGEARAGSLAVCVKTGDGSFFPVSYSANGSRLGDLDAMCHALCPNTDVSVYTYPPSGEIEQAVSSTGQRYMDSPNALKFRTSFDSSVSCRRRGESWAQALAGAEARLGPENKGDIIVTPQKAAELSRAKPDPTPTPKADVKGKGKNAKATPTPTPTAAAGTDVNGVDTNLSAQAATISRETTGIAGGVDASAAPVAKDQGATVNETGPDGVKRKVRIIDPAL